MGHSGTGTSRVSKSHLSTTRTFTSPEPESSDFRGRFFPHKLTATLSALKIVGGCALVGLGATAMVQKAGYARQAAGIWGGVVVIISGVLGAYTVRANATRPFVFTFLFSCLLSITASALVIIYSATGLAQDANQPGGYYLDEEQDKLIPEEELPSREIAMLINTLLIIIGVLDIIFSLPSIIICLREVCECYNPSLLTPHKSGPSYLEEVARKEWLKAWLGQQSHIFYSQSSGIPYSKFPTAQSPYRPMTSRSRTTPPFIHIPSDQSQSVLASSKHSPKDAPQQRQQQRGRSRSKSPNPRQTHSTLHPTKPPSSMMVPPPSHFMSYPPLEVFTPYYPAYGPPPSHPSPNSNLSHPHLVGVHHPMHSNIIPPPWMYSQEWDEQTTVRERTPRRRDHNVQRDHRKRSRSKSQGKEVKKKRQKGLTDSDIERTYTGRDRELAEEFIEQTMEARTATGSEAW